jgi:hypothetical protein
VTPPRSRARTDVWAWARGGRGPPDRRSLQSPRPTDCRLSGPPTSWRVRTVEVLAAGGERGRHRDVLVVVHLRLQHAPQPVDDRRLGGLGETLELAGFEHLRGASERAGCPRRLERPVARADAENGVGVGPREQRVERLLAVAGVEGGEVRHGLLVRQLAVDFDEGDVAALVLRRARGVVGVARGQVVVDAAWGGGRGRRGRGRAGQEGAWVGALHVSGAAAGGGARPLCESAPACQAGWPG